ncbi:MAG: PKD domain-containing protein, partial [Bacteroidetes bacterium]|nr:PKD domain-containing protein [Bacteroidota bacterium]
GTNGQISSVISGGTAGYTYSWSPGGGSGASLSGIGAGTYTLKVTDSKGCISSQTASITQPSALLAAVSVTNESCQYLNNGSASVSVSGGTSGYTYTWQPVGQFTSQINNIPSGSYTVNISDSKGCTTTTVATVTEPAVLSVNLQSQVNVSCNGGNNGSAVVSGIGGTPNYTYSWSPGGSSSSVLSNAVAGTYTVTLTDSRSCQAQTTVSITQPLPLSVSMSGTAVACSGGSSGSAQSIVSGGTAPYSYSWLNNGQTGSSVNGISAGIYTVQVTDSKLCTANGTISISQPSPLSAGLTTTAVSCYNGTNGQISSVISGGTAGYTYSWSPGGGSGASLSGIGAGTYTLKVTDSKGCISSQTASITQPSALLAAVSVTNESCQYLNNGSASVNVSGGTPGYTYTWQPVGQFTSQINNIPSGSYTVNISDSKGCTTTTVATVTEPAVLSVNLQSQVNVSCNGGNNGSAVVSGIGGTPNYTYSWSPGGSSSSVLSNAVAGTYTVTLTDSRSCQAQTTVIITQPNVLTVSTGVTNVSCNGGNNGVISISSSGGTAPYAYTLFPGNIISSNFSSLSPGNYTVVTNDAAGCSKTSTVTINQPTSVSSVIGYTNANCGMQTGNASISITSGGVPPFTYQWLPAGGTGSVSTALAAGSYTVKVSDNNGCLTLNTVNINDIQGPLVSIASTTNVSCFAGSNGAAVATFTGGTGPNYTYQWFPSGGNSLTAAGLQSGYYTIKIIDNAGCIGLATTPFISEPAKIVPVISTQSVSCMGGNNGWATVNANGGTPSYSYLWQPTGQTGSSITNISAGNYTVLVTDSYSCVQTLSFTIAQPASFPSVTIASSSVSCFGGNNGSAVAQAIGGVSPYNFQWNYGAVSGATLSNVPAGIYSVSATDYNGCVTGATVSVTQPAVMSLTVNSSSSDCSQANGSASVSVSGGTGSYTYQWNPGNSVLSTAAGLFAGSYSIVVTDANACSITNSILITDKPAPTLNITGTGSVSCFGGSNGTATLSVSGGTGPFSYSWLPSGGSQPVASGLSAGTYTAQVVSANGCTVQVTTPLITAPLPVLTVVSSTAVACYGGNNGSAGISVSGGIPAYSYTWFPGGMSSAMVSGLTAGIYTVQTSDQNNCIQTTTVQVAEPAQLSVLSTTVVPVSCFGGNTGAASVSITGGTAPFNYAWLPVGSNGPQSSGLTTGTYSVSIHDANNCMTNTVLTVSGPLAPLSVNGYGNGTLCYGGSDGTATVTVAGGTPSYSYQWSPAGGTLSTASNLSNGNYIVTVTDGNNCQASVPIQIAQATPITGTLVPDDASCGLANGAMQSQINGGVGPYQYSWNNATYTTANISNLLPGTYSLQVMDANNCQVTFSASLVNLPGPSVNVVSTQSILCQGGNNGTATASITGTLVPYQFSWLPYGGNQVAATGLTAGTYTAQLIDAKGCTVTANAIIPEPSLLSITTTTVSDVSCFAQANGSAAIAVSGGSPGYSYVWSGSGATGPQATNLVAGNYSVTVHDQNNCSTGYGFVIAQPPALTSTLTGVTNALCYQSVGASTVSAAGGTMPYSYNWTSTPPQTGTIAGGLHAGNFTVTVTDANGCTSTKTLTITQPSQIITHTGINDTICVGQQATVVASASGGSGNYYYVWNPSGSINTGTYNPSPVSNTTYTVMAFDQNGCAGIEDSVDVTVYSLTGANVQVYGETPICPGQASQISATVMGNTGPCTLNWNNGLGSGPGPFVVQPSQPVTYILSVSNACGITVMDSVKIMFNPPPTLAFFSDTVNICAPGIIHFSDQSVTGNPADPISSWNWNFGDGGVSALPDPAYIYNTSGTYTVTLTVTTDAGCTASSVNPIVIHAFPSPSAGFTMNTNYLDIPYDVLHCNNTSSGASVYDWQFGDGATSTSFNVSHLYQSIGNYGVQLIATNQYGCRDTAFADVTTHADVVFPNAFTPNPNGAPGGVYDIASLTNDIFFPYTSGVVDFKLQIYDRWGELIFESEDVKIGWDGYYKGKLCQLGVYVWKAYVKLNNGKEFNKSGDVTLLR